ncbi:MAG: hypothetical protein NBV68_02505 [Erythrobacter sp.]|uniref:hypothetical protein n=1 Tax=Erythrobacter sp. TaxID=1042 RepID=UPI0025D86097|nr:hypothetical protein [Erythrobacter sp.]MCL9998228.1 hypothetical protein [Erythrobacter sp.]
MTWTVDLRLLQDGAVHLFWQRAVLDKWCADLDALGYDLHLIDCTDPGTMRTRFSDVLHWEEQFGYGPWTGNLDALNDGMRGWPFEGNDKVALVLLGFDRHVSRGEREAIALLDIIETQSRNCLLQGARLLALVQTEDRSFFTPDLGGRAAMWNPDEWSNASRGL